MNKLNTIFAAIALAAMILGGCGDDGGTGDTSPADTSTDTVADTTPPVDSAADAPPPVDCTRYCDQLDVNCGGANAQYADRAECLAYCAGAGWPVGTVGEMAGNTIECRIYHAGDPASMDAATHCPHAGASGSTVCGTVAYRPEAAAMFTRVDRIGMPAISTALVGTDTKNAYNDGTPLLDVTGDPPTFAVELITNLGGLHTALDDDLTGLSLVPCDMNPGVALPVCLEQEVAVGVSVVSLVLPDTIQIDGTADAGFPNGRTLADPVMDVTLAIVLLDLTATDQDAGLFAGLPLNPAANDVAFSMTFPYLAAPHTP